MWPAPTLESVFERASQVTDRSDALGERLVSMLFAPPGAKLWKELKFSIAHLDEQTGVGWDLFFIGVPGVARSDSRYGENWSKHFQPRAFRQVELEVNRQHAIALAASGQSPDAAWRHTGGV